MFAEVDELHSVGQLVAQEHLGGAGDDGLPAMGGGHQAGAPVDRQARVAGVIDDHRLVGVQPDPGPQRVCGAPGLRRERLLKRRRRTHGIPRCRERGGHPVAHPREHVTAMGRNRLLEQLVVADHRGLHRAGILLPHPGRALEIGEQKRHRARWWMPGHGLKLTSIPLGTEAFDNDVVQELGQPGLDVVVDRRTVVASRCRHGRCDLKAVVEDLDLFLRRAGCGRRHP